MGFILNSVSVYIILFVFQVTLFDASRKQLDSRFLKKDEVIESGISITLDGHLVEVGEYEANLVQGNNLNISGKEIRHGTYNLLESDKSVRKGWQAWALVFIMDVL